METVCTPINLYFLLTNASKNCFDMDNSFQFSDMLLLSTHLCKLYHQFHHFVICHVFFRFFTFTVVYMQLSCHAAECVLLLVHTIIVVHVVYGVHLDDLICVHKFHHVHVCATIVPQGNNQNNNLFNYILHYRSIYNILCIN